MTTTELRRLLRLIRIKVKEVKGGLLTNKALAEVLEQLVMEIDEGESGTSYDFLNGLYEVDDEVKLGGQLIESTSLFFDNGTLFSLDTENILLVNDGGLISLNGDAGLSLQTLTTASSAARTGFQIVKDIDNPFNERTEFYSNLPNPRGAGDAGDYSANKQALDYITKQMLEDALPEDVYVRRRGDTMTGNLTFGFDDNTGGNINPDAGVGLFFNNGFTDYGAVYYESTGDQNESSNLIIETGDNNPDSVLGANEGIIFRHWNGEIGQIAENYLRLTPRKFVYRDKNVVRSINDVEADIDGNVELDINGGGDVYTSGGPGFGQTITKHTEFSDSLYLTGNPFATENFNLVGANTADGKVYRIDTALFAQEGDYIIANPDTAQDAFINIGEYVSAANMYAYDSMYTKSFNVRNSDDETKWTIRATTVTGYPNEFTINEFGSSIYKLRINETDTFLRNQITLEGYSGVGDRSLGVDSTGKLKIVTGGEGSFIQASPLIAQDDDILLGENSSIKIQKADLSQENEMTSDAFYARAGVGVGYMGSQGMTFQNGATDAVTVYAIDQVQYRDITSGFPGYSTYFKPTSKGLLTNSVDIELPNKSGILPISVNGIFADDEGNIDIAIEGGTTYAFTNGLSESGGTAKLGGPLLNAVTRIGTFNAMELAFLRDGNTGALNDFIIRNRRPNGDESFFYLGGPDGYNGWELKSQSGSRLKSTNTGIFITDDYGLAYNNDTIATKTFPADNLWVPPAKWSLDKYKSGTYNPTLTVIQNAQTPSAQGFRYIKVDNTVFVTGFIQVSTLTAAVGAGLRISLPIPTDLAVFGDLTGVATEGFNEITSNVEAETTSNDAALYYIIATGKTLGSRNFNLSFSYTIK